MAPLREGYSSHFGITNIPFGIGTSAQETQPTCVSRYEDQIIFLSKLDGAFKQIPGLPKGIFKERTLNPFAALPKCLHRHARTAIQDIIRSGIPENAVEDISKVEMHIPFDIGDFTDFSCSLDHVQNASEAMTGTRSQPPAFFHLPIGYAGRCSSIDVSGNPVERPMGQYLEGKPGSNVVFGPSRKMDYELELGCFIGKPVARNQRVLAADAEEHIFGYVLVNDWSARDIQGFEMIPLGPLNGKNAGTTISPFVITTDAVSRARTASTPRRLPVAPYLRDRGKEALNVTLKVEVSKPGIKAVVTCTSNSSWMYWTLGQCLAHQAIGGCGLRTGDLLATGTVSGSNYDEHGCLMEYMKPGKTPPRGYVEDGEKVSLSGLCGDGVGFGECVASLTPARELCAAANGVEES